MEAQQSNNHGRREIKAAESYPEYPRPIPPSSTASSAAPQATPSGHPEPFSSLVSRGGKT
jgi:hypothetical protein